MSFLSAVGSSLQGTAAAGAGGVAQHFVKNLLIKNQRQITSESSGRAYVPNIVVEERHRDELEITEHPVERGAQISDHAFKKPSTLYMRAQWRFFRGHTLSGLLGINATGNPYQDLLKLQGQRELLDLMTGKRKYTGMLLREIEVTTDVDSENNLTVRLGFQQIIFAQTTVTSIPATAVNRLQLPRSANPANDNGTKQLQTGTSSGIQGVVQPNAPSSGFGVAHVLTQSGNISVSKL